MTTPPPRPVSEPRNPATADKAKTMEVNMNAVMKKNELLE